jgi:hypothetical protein
MHPNLVKPPVISKRDSPSSNNKSYFPRIHLNHGNESTKQGKSLWKRLLSLVF